MKKFVVSLMLITVLFFLFGGSAKAYENELFDDRLIQLRDSLSPEAADRLAELGWDGTPESISDLDIRGLFSQVTEDISSGLSGPMSAGCVLICVIALCAVMEGYTSSLRYSETRAVMSTVGSVMTAAVLTEPVAELARSAVSSVSEASGIMLIFIPVMIGIISFSGHIPGTHGATAMAACQFISQLSSKWLMPLLGSFLALAVSSGISVRIRVKAICDLLYSFIKWTLVFMMSIFSIVLSLQSAVSGAADTVASRAVRLTLSSFIPVVGSAISEAYRIVQGSVGILRSGVGVFAVMAVVILFLPLLVKASLWLISVNITKCAAQVLGVDASAALLSSVGAAISLLIAVSVCVMTVFIISAAVMMNSGGAS